MKKYVVMMLAFVFTISLVLSGCSVGTKDPAKSAEPKTSAKKELSGEITVWSFGTGLLDQFVPIFNKKYPNVKVNMVSMSFNEMHEKLLTTIAAGTGAPDVAAIEGGSFKKFNNIEGLEDLNQPLYNVKKYRNDFTESNWNRWTSLDGKKQLGMPWDMPPFVTFYRADILEENGFPSDPAELAKYMENSDNFFKMAQTLKAKDKYMISGNTDVMDIYNGYGMFDHDLKYLRNTDKWAKGLDMAKKVKQLELALGENVFTDKGKQALSSGKLAMVFLGSWGENTIKDKNPENAGKWRVTALPFGSYAGQGGSTMSITTQSKNKELAWAFVETSMATIEAQEEQIKKNVIPGYKPAWKSSLFQDSKSDFLGGQKAKLLYGQLLDKIPVTSNVASTLDVTAGNIWSKGIADAIEKNMDSKAVLQQIADDIDKAVSVDRLKMLDNMKK